MKKTIFAAILAVFLSLVLLLPAVAADSGFTDIPAGASYAGAVDWCVENGLMNGVGGNRFNPTGTLDRRTLATVLYRDAGEPAVSAANRFSDVPNGQWYTDAVIWADQQKLITGYGGGFFGATDPVTRVQMDVIFQRYQGENPVWPGDPAQTPVTRAEVAVAFYQNLAKQEEFPMNKLTVSFNGHSYPATLEDNPTAEAFAELIRACGGSITLFMENYGGFEKVGPLGQSLPRNDAQTTTAPGDFVLYSGNQIVLFYGSNAWSYTRLGRLEGDLSGLQSDLGDGDVSITYSLS